MGTRYQILDAYRDVLAEELDGNYCEGTVTLKVLLGDNTVHLEVPSEWVAEVKPPLSPEPPVGSVVRDREYTAWQRRGGGGWGAYGIASVQPWDELSREWGPLILLVPDPLAEAPELPWASSEPGLTRSTVGVDECDVYDINEFPGGQQYQIYLTPDKARAKARALWAAADEADRRSPPLTPQARPRSCPTCHSPGRVTLGPFDDQRCDNTWHRASPD